MSDVVVVALIGVIGTLVGSVLAPVVKDRVDRKSRARESTLADLRERVLTISQTLKQMVRLGDDDHDEWSRLWAKLDGEAARLELLLAKGEGEVANLVSAMFVFARPGKTEVDRNLNPMVVSAAVASLNQWFRGERKAKGIAQDMFDFASKMQMGFIDGSIMPGGKPIPDSMLNDDELQQRNARN